MPQPSDPPATSRLRVGRQRGLQNLFLAGAVLVSCALGSCMLACSEENEDPARRCEELCAQNRCPRDSAPAQCLATCEEWHDLCPSAGRTFVLCANTQFDEDFVCDDFDEKTRLADGLCDNEDDALRKCLNNE